VSPFVLDPELKARWDSDGWCVVPGAIPPGPLAAAQDAVHRYFPTPAEMAELGGAESGRWHTWDATWPEFPFHSKRLNALVLHDNVVDLAEAFLGTADLACYMGIVTASTRSSRRSTTSSFTPTTPTTCSSCPATNPAFSRSSSSCT
jgi:hypothetical protein